MGNCQAIDNATLLIQHPGGRVDKLYWPVTASEIMKMNPGHYVALLLTTTLLQPSAAAGDTAKTTKKITNSPAADNNKNNSPTSAAPVRITKIKLLKPTDTLVLGHVYRLIATQEVMKGVWAKKYAKMKKQQQLESEDRRPMMVDKPRLSSSSSSDSAEPPPALIRRSRMEDSNKAKQERHRQRTTAQLNSAASAKSRGWQPSLRSISEAAI